ncbi:MAG: hypothetical protein JWN70_928 [Planctomycetaceae bacterium]|nr:hypothetical protein [Planctomycetaceae bacterium]
MQTFESWLAPVSAAALDAAELRLGITFPQDYRDFIIRTNGLNPRGRLCFKVQQKDEVLLGCLFGIGTERSGGDLEYEQEDATLWDPLPPGMAAIGNDPGGNLLLLDTLGPQAGRVSFWDRVGIWVGTDGRNVFFVAGSFGHFLRLLHSCAECA